MSTTEYDLREDIAPMIRGHSHQDVVEALGSLLGQAIADCSPDVDTAVEYLGKVHTAIAADIRENFHLVIARRKRG